jgi:hypothetical protein
MFHDGLRTTVLTMAISASVLSLGGAARAQQPSPEQRRYNVPPPSGYQLNDERSETSARARAEDERYSYVAERWAARNCVAEHASNAAAGAVIGGLLGAVVGSGLAGRHERAAGAIAGGAVGAVAGGAIGGSTATPGCPPGYVLRSGASPFDPGPVYTGVVYVAPPWYDPWIWYGHHWLYRPYPFHRYWYRLHHR